MLGDVERERRLAHARPAGDDDEIAPLQAGGALVQIVVAGRNAGDVRRVVALIERFHPLHDAREQLLDVVESLLTPGTGLGNLEHFGLGLVEDLPDVLAGRVERRIGDFGAHFDQLSHDCAVANDLGIATDVLRRRSVLRQRAEIGEAPGPVAVLAGLDGLVDRHHVSRAAFLYELGDVAPDAPVIVAIEVCARKAGHRRARTPRCPASTRPARTAPLRSNEAAA